MTLAADAISVTATQGNPIMLTEYGSPSALILNLGQATVYVGTTSSVGPGTGVPLPAGSFINWTTDHQPIWVIVDPGAPAGTTCQVTMTERINDWAPSPAIVAAAVAAGLLASGIPSVYLDTVVQANDVLAAAETREYVVSHFASLTVCVQASPDPRGALQLSFYGPASDGDIIANELLFVPNGDRVTWQIPVISGRLIITNSTTNPLFVEIDGTNRIVPGIRMLGDTLTPREFDTGPVAIGAGLNVQAAPVESTKTATTFNGQVWIHASNSGTAGSVLLYYTIGGGVYYVCSVPFSGNVYVPFNHPRQAITWGFHGGPGAAGAAGAHLQITPGE